MFTKWVMGSEMILDDVHEFNEYIKSNKDLIRKLDTPLVNYKSYYNAMLDITKLRKEERVKKVFKDGLNGSSRKFFRKTFETHKKLYMRLHRNDFKMKVFFRNSSKPHTLNDYIIHLKRSLHFSSDMSGVIDRIEDKYNYIRTSKGAFIFELTEEMLDMVPNTWCMYNSSSDYDREKSNRNLHSIWLLLDPYEKRNDRKIVGIDVPDDFGTILYMDSLNNRFTDDVPVTEDEFYDLTKTMIDKPSDEDVDFIVKSYVDEIRKQENDRRSEETKSYGSTKNLFDHFWDSK